MKIFSVLAATAIAGVPFLAATPAGAFWWGNNDYARRSEAIPINQQELVNDYQKNSVRFSKNWVGSLSEQFFLTASGYVDGSVENWGFVLRMPSKIKLENGRRAEFFIQCSNLGASKKFKDDISMLDDGDYVKTSFNVRYSDPGGIDKIGNSTWFWLKTENCMVES